MKTTIQELEANERILQKMEQKRLDRYSILVKRLVNLRRAIAFSYAKDAGLDHWTEGLDRADEVLGPK